MSKDLLAAIEAHDTEKVLHLLKCGVSPNGFSDIWCCSVPTRPLDLALSEIEEGGPVDIVKALITAGADVNAWDVNNSYKPLHGAVTLECVRILLENGADPNCRSDCGETPLINAVEEGEYEIVELLLQYGGSKTINELGGMAARTALGYAVDLLDVKMVELLLNNGADPNSADEDGMPARLFLRQETEVNTQSIQAVRKMLNLLK